MVISRWPHFFWPTLSAYIVSGLSVKRRCHVPLVLKTLDCHVTENATRHNTTHYQQTKDSRPAHLRHGTANHKPADAEDSAHQQVAHLFQLLSVSYDQPVISVLDTVLEVRQNLF